MQKKLFIVMIASVYLGYAWRKNADKKNRQRKESNAQRYLSVYRPWLEKMQKGESVADFIAGKQYSSIAIYGLGKLGVSLINELRGRGIQIAYIIDRRAEEIFYRDIEVYPFSDMLPEVGAVIITTVNDQQELKEKVMRHMECDVYTLEELVMT